MSEFSRQVADLQDLVDRARRKKALKLQALAAVEDQRSRSLLRQTGAYLPSEQQPQAPDFQDATKILEVLSLFQQLGFNILEQPLSSENVAQLAESVAARLYTAVFQLNARSSRAEAVIKEIQNRARLPELRSCSRAFRCQQGEPNLVAIGVAGYPENVFELPDTELHLVVTKSGFAVVPEKPVTKQPSQAYSIRPQGKYLDYQQHVFVYQVEKLEAGQEEVSFEAFWHAVVGGKEQRSQVIASVYQAEMRSSLKDEDRSRYQDIWQSLAQRWPKSPVALEDVYVKPGQPDEWTGWRDDHGEKKPAFTNPEAVALSVDLTGKIVLSLELVPALNNQVTYLLPSGGGRELKGTAHYAVEDGGEAVQREMNEEMGLEVKLVEELGIVFSDSEVLNTVTELSLMTVKGRVKEPDRLQGDEPHETLAMSLTLDELRALMLFGIPTGEGQATEPMDGRLISIIAMAEKLVRAKKDSFKEMPHIRKAFGVEAGA